MITKEAGHGLRITELKKLKKKHYEGLKENKAILITN